MPALATLEQLTTAGREAQSNFRNNQRALEKNQPATAALLDQTDLTQEWIYARDGSLTARAPDGKWWADCSVPMLAGRSLLKTLESLAAGSCLLAPAHTGLVRAARERMGSSSVLFVVQDDPHIARMILSCHDFSEQIAQHRFWILCGPTWPSDLQAAFEKYPGLAVPTRFIRTPLTPDELIAPLIKSAQEVFSAVVSNRTRQLQSMQAQTIPKIDPHQMLLICGSEFRLWDDAPAILQQQLSISDHGNLKLQTFDTDNALYGSPLALLEAAQQSGSIVSANLCRADCNHLISTQLPWITWVTQPAIPAYDSAASKDGLILADPNWKALAQKAGWPEFRIRVAGWPTRELPSSTTVADRSLAMICDTLPIEAPVTVKEFSSHNLLWDLIAEELAADPLAVEKIDHYLTDRAKQLNIEVAALDRRSFISNLIIPAYQQGLARLLIQHVVPIKLWGHGWSTLSEFAAHSHGIIATPEDLNQAIATAAGLIYAWPERHAHPIDSFNKPILQRSGRDRQQLLSLAQQITSGSRPPARPAPNLLSQVIVELLK